jgi:hypothetical protein
MCLISAIPIGVEKDIAKIRSFIENGMSTNTDGSGYACKKNGVLKIDKGFRSVDAIIDSIKEKKLGINDELIIHHRIGTSGLKNNLNMHPFLVSEDIEAVKTVVSYNVNVPIIAHNGVFHQYTDRNSEYSDTFHFVKDFLATPEFIAVLKKDPDKFKRVFAGILGTNRLSILFPDRDMLLIGDFKEEDGCFHSNGGYKSRVCNVGGIEYPGKDWDQLDEDEWLSKRDKILGNIGRSRGLGIDMKLEQSKASKNVDSNVRNLVSVNSLSKFKSKYIKITERNFKHFRLIVREKDFNNDIKKGRIYEIEDFKEDVTFNPIVAVNKEREIYHISLDHLLPLCDIYTKSEYSKLYQGLSCLIKTHGDNPSMSVIKKIKTILSRKFQRDSFKFKGYGVLNWFDLNHYYNTVKNIQEEKAIKNIEETIFEKPSESNIVGKVYLEKEIELMYD